MDGVLNVVGFLWGSDSGTVPAKNMYILIICIKEI